MVESRTRNRYVRWLQAAGAVVVAGTLAAAAVHPRATDRRDTERRDRSPASGSPILPRLGGSASGSPAGFAGAAVAALGRHIDQVSASYLGSPYARDPLGEGPGARPDPDPLFRRDRVDCVTFVEQVLAEAMARASQDHLALLTRLRYRGGVVGFATRNHYMVSDWLRHNRWCVADVTSIVGEGGTRQMAKIIDRAAFFRRRGAPEEAARAPVERSVTSYVPRAGIATALDRFPDVALLIWVQDRPGIIAAHCGFAIRREDGVLFFRHASERRGRVLEEPLLAYLRAAPRRIVGVKVCVARPPLDTVQRRR
jgi:hypothetical protein